MKYCRFTYKGSARYGVVESSKGVERITHVLATPPEQVGKLKSVPTEQIEPLPLLETPLLMPVQPSKIVCVGRNYRGHAAEMGSEVPKEPLLFFQAALFPLGPRSRHPPPIHFRARRSRRRAGRGHREALLQIAA